MASVENKFIAIVFLPEKQYCVDNFANVIVIPGPNVIIVFIYSQVTPSDTCYYYAERLGAFYFGRSDTFHYYNFVVNRIRFNRIVSFRITTH